MWQPVVNENGAGNSQFSCTVDVNCAGFVQLCVTYLNLSIQQKKTTTSGSYMHNDSGLNVNKSSKTFQSRVMYGGRKRDVGGMQR